MSTHIGRKAFLDSHVFQGSLRPADIGDMLGLVARDPGPWGVNIAVALTKTQRISSARAAPWTRIAAPLALSRARTHTRRHDAGEALNEWQSLVDGKWTLVDHFDTDGRRFLVARRNPPGGEQPTLARSLCVKARVRAKASHWRTLSVKSAHSSPEIRLTY